MGANLTKSENGIIQIAIFWSLEIPFKITVLQGKCHIIILLRLSSISFALKCEGCTRTFSVCTTFLGFLQLLDFHQKDFCSSRESMDEFPCTSLSLWSCPLQQALKCSFKFAFPRIKQLRCFQGVSISQKITFGWYNLKRLKLTNFWHNMPSAAAKIFRRNFSTKIEVADKKFCTSYITQFAVSSKIFQKKSSALRCVAFHIFLLGLDLTWLFPDRRGLLGFSEINGSNHPQNSIWTKTKKGRIQHHLKKKLCGMFFCFFPFEGAVYLFVFQ